VRCRDRPKLLFDTVCTLTDMQYVVFHGTVIAEGSEAYQVLQPCLSLSVSVPAMHPPIASTMRLLHRVVLVLWLQQENTGTVTVFSLPRCAARPLQFTLQGQGARHLGLDAGSRLDRWQRCLAEARYW